MQISKAITKSGKKIIKAIKKLSPQARLAKKLQHDSTRVSTRKNEKISMSWWSLEVEKPQVEETYMTYVEQTVPYQCGCCCCQFADDENLRNENLENDNLRNENIENEMLAH